MTLSARSSFHEKAPSGDTLVKVNALGHDRWDEHGI